MRASVETKKVITRGGHPEDRPTQATLKYLNLARFKESDSFKGPFQGPHLRVPYYKYNIKKT